MSEASCAGGAGHEEEDKRTGHAGSACAGLEVVCEEREGKKERAELMKRSQRRERAARPHSARLSRSRGPGSRSQSTQAHEDAHARESTTAHCDSTGSPRRPAPPPAPPDRARSLARSSSSTLRRRRLSYARSRPSVALESRRRVDLVLEQLPPLDLVGLLQDVERLVQLRAGRGRGESASAQGPCTRTRGREGRTVRAMPSQNWSCDSSGNARGSSPFCERERRALRQYRLPLSPTTRTSRRGGTSATQRRKGPSRRTLGLLLRSWIAPPSGA